MNVNAPAIQVRDFEWATHDGATEGVFGDYEYEINISAASRGSLKWGEAASNIRTWIAYGDNRVEIARGEADGLSAAKRDAVAAINSN